MCVGPESMQILLATQSKLCFAAEVDVEGIREAE